MTRREANTTLRNAYGRIDLNGNRGVIVIAEGPKFMTLLDPSDLSVTRVSASDARHLKVEPDKRVRRRVLRRLKRRRTQFDQWGVPYPRRTVKAAVAQLSDAWRVL